ncbi:uncharacterized protein C11orf71 homolog [Pteronotus mesoamericanus]|uniref:uncharacterized protein C11orf71 homolog n=1 Tax=Pteronotus mesoamericanus TaxID=1884717 RepID=UPI0023EC3674|nr:uncharacterized protein C11orf71 homolog [Pteronotus parnellii mesoamericanus]
MVLNSLFLCAGDQGNRMMYCSSHGDLSPSALAWAMVSGDSGLVARSEAVHPGPTPWQVVRQTVRIETRRATGGNWSLRRFVRGGDPDGRSRSGWARFSPYPTPGFALNLQRSV